MLHCEEAHGYFVIDRECQLPMWEFRPADYRFVVDSGQVDWLTPAGRRLASCEWLEMEVGQGLDEVVVARAFTAVVLGFKYS